MSIKIRKQVCADTSRALEMEWLDTNGIGGYASSTILGCHTRKYHGLLVARLAEPRGKFVLLSKLEDSLFFDDEELFMTAHQYSDTLFPGEHGALVEFGQARVLSFKYRFRDAHVLKEIAMLEGEDTVLVKYTCTKNRVGAKLRVKPLIAYRGFHDTAKENVFLRVRTFPIPGGFLVSPYDGMPSLHFQNNCPSSHFYPAPVWYRRFHYSYEARRGFDASEDLFCPGIVELDFEKGTEVVFSASTGEQSDDLANIWDRELDRRRRFSRKLRGTPFQKSLKRAARQFVSSDGSGHRSIVAGYPWFQEWGRDAMIALPGLMLYSGLAETYVDVLKSFAAHRRDGIIPNFLGETPEADAFNSADASLWFAWAVQQHVGHTRSTDAIKGDILDALRDIFRSYRDGTDHGIRMRDDGLLNVGSPDEQVTWMDAVVDGRPVSPRWGSPVEINALWYNMVAFLADLDPRLDADLGAEARELVPRIEAAFNDAFWLEEEGCLADVYRDEGLDSSLRPNQIFAVSLPYSPLSTERARRVLAKVKEELATPVGLRTLSPTDPLFKARYEGGPAERDSAYHNGTVWPWLLGHYGEGLLKVSSDKTLAIEELEQSIKELEDHLYDAGIGTISEIFDGTKPQAARGCTSQAWSVGEILRLTKLIENEKNRMAEGKIG
ncbi:MAG: glycogen debranching protein [Deltaproteobacteria bacterium]|nr:glycogen debranching protein [Deltaproteobacteria bacterium]